MRELDVIIFSAAVLCAGFHAPAGAQVVINEMLYHPASDQELDEFLELHNCGTASVSLAGWCIPAIDLCFDAGTVIEPQGYLTVARDAVQFQTTFGFAPDAVFAGRLSNSGERLELQNASGVPVDVVEYSDHGDWPPSADGLGPSLERIVPTSPGSAARNWHASVAPAGHTAGAENSVRAGALPPWISEVAFTAEPAPGQPIIVTCRLEDASTVGLTYVIDFGPEVQVAMADDGLHEDGAAGDGVLGAILPGQAAAALVRFRLATTGPTGSMQHPRDDDTVNYVGTIVPDPALSSNVPVFHWYMDPADYQAALAHYLTDEVEPAVFYYDGNLHDNIQVRVRGHTSRYWAKKCWKFYFPQGHEFSSPERMPGPVDQFNLQSGYSDKSYCREIMAYESFRAMGSPGCLAFHVRVQQNGALYGLYTCVEGMDRDYLERNRLDAEGAWYKAYHDCRLLGMSYLPTYYQKKTREWEDHADLYDLLYGLNSLSGSARAAFLRDHVNIPDLVNYLAVTCVIHNNDHPAKNYYLYRDTLGTQRWSMHPWDMDLTFGRNFGAPTATVLCDGIWADNDVIDGRENVSPSHPLFGDSEHQKYDHLWNRFIDKLYEDAPIRAMYYRRLRTVMDELLAPGTYEARLAELTAPIASLAEADRLKWGQYGQSQTLTQAAALITDDYLPRRRNHLFVTHRVPGEIPETQTIHPPILISEIHYQPLDEEAEFVELYNPSPDEAVDLSGWRLRGLSLTLPPGAVILPQDYLLVVRSDVAFRTASGGGVCVAAQYDGKLDNGGETLELLDRGGYVVDVVAYDSLAPWPVAAAGGGPSLELIDATQDNNRPSNWSASVAAGGTPGAANSTAGTTNPVPDLWINEILPVNASVNADEQAEYEPWVEFYNSSLLPIDLGGMYLTDDYLTPAKWQIPAGTVLGGGDWLVVWADNEPGDGPLHATFILDGQGGAVGLFTVDQVVIDYVNYGGLPVDVSFGRFPDAEPTYREFGTATPGSANQSAGAAVILNEYNAVSSGNYLKDAGTDVVFGRSPENGGDWFELAVTQDHVDLRGWTLVWTEAPSDVGTLTLTDDVLWSDLRAGTIITFIEKCGAEGGWDADASYDPGAGDWWIHINTRCEGVPQETYVTTTTNVPGDGPGNFSVGNDNWQLTILDAQARVVFGPAGEGIEPLSGIGSDEVFRLEEDPGPYIHSRSDYNDGTSSTFGAPNRYAGEMLEQSFEQLRECFEPCATADDCADGDPCTVDTCDPFHGCLHAVASNGMSCEDGFFCNGAETCQAGVCVSGMTPCIDPAHCDEATDVCLPCFHDEDCSDGNPCTPDLCLDEQCVREIFADGTPCSDGDACTQAGTCQGGVCVGGMPVDCDDANPCTVDACEPSTGCVNTAVEDGIDCDNGDYCDGQDVCQSGICVGGIPPCTGVCEQCDELTDTCDWCRFDLDGSEWIAGGDFGVFSGCFGACYPPGDPCLTSNFDEDVDGCVGGGDFGLFSGCFAQTCDQCPTCFGPPPAGKRLAEPDDGSRARLALVVVAAPSPAGVVTTLPECRSGFAVGDVVWLELWAQGGRPADGKEEGLAAVYVDLTFDHTRLALGEIVPSGHFPLFACGTTGAADGLVKALGGCAPLGEAALGTGGTWVRVAGLQLKATSAGRAFVRCDSADPPFGVAVMNRFGDLQTWQVEYGAAVVAIRRAVLTVPDPGVPISLGPAD
ncbi:MAG: CotH kinase family protein [Phycisphaerae bacterium]|nr:CotH kinase family protein [Phycisphaerae bacterium]